MNTNGFGSESDCAKKTCLFNVCELGNVSPRTVQRVFACCSDMVSEEDIFRILGHTGTSEIFVSDLRKIDRLPTSLFLLYSIGINLFIIEDLRQRFRSVEDLREHWDQIFQFHFQDRTLHRVHDFLFCATSSADSAKEDYKKRLIDFLSSSPGAHKKDSLFQCCKFTDASLFSESVNDLSLEKVVKISANGIELWRESISGYFNNNTRTRNLSILFDRISGMTFCEICKKYGISRQRVDQIVEYEIHQLPEFDQEKKYADILLHYDLDNELCSSIGLSELMLVSYVKIKYRPLEKKSEIDYLVDNRLLSTRECEKSCVIRNPCRNS